MAKRRCARAPARLATLKVRADFLRVAAAAGRAAAPGLVLQAAPRSGLDAENAPPRVGFTASRKVGKAVARNRAKRRLRAVARQILQREGRAGTDYVLIARAATLERPYRALVEDLQSALRRIAHRSPLRREAAAEEE